MQIGLRIVTPQCLKVMRMSKVCYVQVRVDECSDPYVAVSAEDVFLLHQSAGVLFNMCMTPVTDLTVMTL